jgi:hypothetical protein
LLLFFPSLTQNDICTRLSAFALQWKDTHKENADAKLFCARLYECFYIRPESATIYQQAIEKLDGAKGYIDSLTPDLLIVEHKSKGGLPVWAVSKTHIAVASG